MRVKTLIVLLALVMFASFSLSCKKGLHDKKMRKSHMVMRGVHWWWHNQNILEKLNLTDDQAEKINDLKTKSQKEMIKKGSSLAEKMIDLRDAMTQPNLDEAKIKNLMNEVSKAQTTLWTTHMQTYLEGAKILTPDQRKKLRGLISDGPPDAPPHDRER